MRHVIVREDPTKAILYKLRQVLESTEDKISWKTCSVSLKKKKTYFLSCKQEPACSHYSQMRTKISEAMNSIKKQRCFSS